MAIKDYGEFAQKMRTSRGYTQEQLAELAGVSISTIKNLEWSNEDIVLRASSLDAILIALAQKAPLGGTEIQVLVAATGRKFESIEALNERAELLRRAAMAGPSPRMASEPTLDERIDQAVHQLIAAGQGQNVLVQLEALARLYGDLAADHERTPRPKRRLRVRRSLRREGTMDIEDIAHYPIDDDDDDQGEGHIASSAGP